MEELTNRRLFLKKSAISLGGIYLGTPIFLNGKEETTKITILHTNDVHSHIEAIKKGYNKGYGGVLQRGRIINQIRKKEKNVLLFDAGDIFQGTPYFNLYKGELELKLMSLLKYDGATIGNHDFDAGIDGLAKQLPHANFPFIISNYDFSNTPMNQKFLSHKIYDIDGIRIGVFGLGIELNGLVPKKLYTETQYLDPIKVANKKASFLKHDMKCNLIICLSHLGYKYNENKVSDSIIAKKTKYIDLIIGGHTHTFLKEPTSIMNNEQKTTLINQVGWAGIYLGKIDFYFNKHQNITAYKTQKREVIDYEDLKTKI